MPTDLHGANILVTGGAGFVGSHIVDQALAAGAARIAVIDDFVRGRRENLASAMATERLNVIEGDICDEGLIDELTEGVDIVFHQAALRITQCAEEPVRAVRVMINGTQNVLEAALRHKVQRVIAASSASVYGEPSYLPIDEAHPFNNRTLYGAAKIANEQILRSYAEMFGMQYVMLRYFNIYGPRMDIYGVYTEVLARWMDRIDAGQAPVIFGDGTQSMDLVYVGDVARSNILAAQSDVTDEVFNVGTGVETTLRQLCEMLLVEMGRPDLEPVHEPERKVNPVRRRTASVDRAKAAIGFEAAASVRDGLRELIAWRKESLCLS
ncbi:MAG TPA: NAD-dependent epimerase/dehydratase family protein [Dehalococcoidia bacterium]